MKKLLLIVLLFALSVSIQAQSYVPKSDTVTIALGATLSEAFDTDGYKIFTIKVPSTFDGTTITIYHSEDTTSANFNAVYDLDDNAILTFTVTAGREYRFKPADWFYLKRYIKILSSTTVATTADKFLVTRGKY